MNKDINVAEILKTKEKGTKLYDTVRDIDVYLYNIVGENDEIHCSLEKDKGKIIAYSYNGTIPGFVNGKMVLVPSREMRDWEKFQWKKGDLLSVIESRGRCGLILFDEWYSDDYTSFNGYNYVVTGRYNLTKCKKYRSYRLNVLTEDFEKNDDNYTRQNYNSYIGKYFGKVCDEESTEIKEMQEYIFKKYYYGREEGTLEYNSGECIPAFTPSQIKQAMKDGFNYALEKSVTNLQNTVKKDTINQKIDDVKKLINNAIEYLEDTNGYDDNEDDKISFAKDYLYQSIKVIEDSDKVKIVTLSEGEYQTLLSLIPKDVFK